MGFRIQTNLDPASDVTKGRDYEEIIFRENVEFQFNLQPKKRKIRARERKIQRKKVSERTLSNNSGQCLFLTSI